MMMVRFHSLVAFKRSLVARKLTSVIDITGNSVYCAVPSSLQPLDDAIVDMLASNSDARPKLRQALVLDKAMNFAHVLNVYEELRYDSHFLSGKSVQESLSRLETQQQKGLLSQREAWYSAAALAWSEGDYTLAGRFLESSMLQSPSDLLAVRLAQDAYMTCGSIDNVLGCLIRHPSTIETPAHLNGFLLGIIATGYAETGRTKLAEEEGERAVESTRGQNCWSLHALMNTYQLACRSSEMYGKLDEYEKKHENTLGLCHLYFNRGSAHIMRGNYSGAFKSFDELMDLLETTDATGRKTTVGPAWTNAVLLLWQLTLNTRDFNEDTFGPMWRVLSLYAAAPSTPMQCLCSSIVYSSAAVAAPARTARPPPAVANTTSSTSSSTDVASKQSSEASTDNTDKEKGWWEQITSAVTASRKPRRQLSGNVEQDSEDAQRDSLRQVSRHIRDKYRDKIALQAAQGVDLRQLLAAHISAMKSGSFAQPPGEGCPDFPALRAIQPTIRAVRGIQESTLLLSSSSGGLSDLQYCLQRSVVPLSEALHAFNEQQYVRAGEAFLDLAPQIQLLGGTAAQRMVIEQMAIESLHRGGDLASTTLLLHERSVLVPHDAQCWRRLAAIYGQTGQEALAKQAHYTAWQLGIGQGGFGGPR